MMGGGMRQIGVLAAAGLIALEKMPARLSEDHANARLLAELLSKIPRLDVHPERVQTNIVVVGVQDTGYDSSRFLQLLKQRGVLSGTVDENTLRLLTHLDVNRTQIVQAAQIFRDVLER